MKIIQWISSETPKWAAKAQVFIVFVFTSIVMLQQTNVIDILPIDPIKRGNIKAWGAVLAIVGGLVLSAIKKKEVTTVVTTPPTIKEPPPYDINQDLEAFQPKKP